MQLAAPNDLWCWPAATHDMHETGTKGAGRAGRERSLADRVRRHVGQDPLLVAHAGVVGQQELRALAGGLLGVAQGRSRRPGQRRAGPPGPPGGSQQQPVLRARAGGALCERRVREVRRRGRPRLGLEAGKKA